MKNLILLFLFVWVLLGQHPVLGQSRGTCIQAFDAETGKEISKFCVGRKVRFKSCNPDSRPDQEYYHFGQDNNLQFPDTTKFYTYNKPGTYKVTQLINTGANGVHQGSRTFEVVASPKPRFIATGCSERSISVSITDQNYDRFVVTFGGNVSQTVGRGSTLSHRFLPGQAMQVAVTGHYNDAPCSLSADTTVRELPLPPQPRLAKLTLALAASDTRLTFHLEQLRPEYQYLIEKQSGSGFVAVDTIRHPATAQLSKTLVRTEAPDQACYRIRVTDPCNSSLNIYSNTVCPLELRASTGQGIELSWPAYGQPAQIKGYQLFKNNKAFRDLPGTQTSFTDDKAPCNKQSCYRLVAILNDNVLSESNQTCLTALSSPAPAKPYLSSSFDSDNQILLKLQVPSGQLFSQITYQKSVDGSAYSDLNKGTQTTLRDKAFDKQTLTCYQASYRDSCDQVSPLSNQTCPIVLTAELRQDNTVQLSWTSYTGFPTGPVQYRVQRLHADGTVLSSEAASGHAYTDGFKAEAGQKIFYRIEGQVPGQEATYSNTEQVAFESSARIPTAFTPNGDQLNDVFEVKGRFITLTSLRIYDRWGQVLYQSQQQGWDGTISGKPAPPGSYPYSVSWKDENGRQTTKTGVVTLLR